MFGKRAHSGTVKNNVNFDKNVILDHTIIFQCKLNVSINQIPIHSMVPSEGGGSTLSS
jgi:hypothetical protein